MKVVKKGKKIIITIQRPDILGQARIFFIKSNQTIESLKGWGFFPRRVKKGTDREV